MKAPQGLALLLAILLAFSCGQTRATETTRSALQTQNSAAITSNGAGQISGTTLNGLLANIIDSSGFLQSDNSWTGQNVFSKLSPTSRGTCTMVAGACMAQSLGATFSVAPVCLLSWTGTGTLAGVLKITSTTTTASPASSNAGDTAQVNWVCFGS